MIAPCKGCDRRHAACWAECEDYKAWRAEMDAERQARWDDDQKRSAIESVRRRMMKNR